MGTYNNYGTTKYSRRENSEELQFDENTITTVKRFKYFGSAVQEIKSPDLEI